MVRLRNHDRVAFGQVSGSIVNIPILVENDGSDLGIVVVENS